MMCGTLRVNSIDVMKLNTKIRIYEVIIRIIDMLIGALAYHIIVEWPL